jgi:hypothetical protein
MATALSKPVIREIEFTDSNGNKGLVNVTLERTGIGFAGKGKQRKLFIPWGKMVPVLPPNAPARFACNPFGWLIEKSAAKSGDK